MDAQNLCKNLQQQQKCCSTAFLRPRKNTTSWPVSPLWHFPTLTTSTTQMHVTVKSHHWHQQPIKTTHKCAESALRATQHEVFLKGQMCLCGLIKVNKRLKLCIWSARFSRKGNTKGYLSELGDEKNLSVRTPDFLEHHLSLFSVTSGLWFALTGMEVKLQ